MATSTAHWIAAARARETRRPDRLFADPWAEQLAGERGVEMLTRSEQAAGSENTFIPVRVRWFDDAIVAAVSSGITQVVLLGAGLDTRPYRLDLPLHVDWYELDRSTLLSYKEQALTGAQPRCKRVAVEANLAEDWVGPLQAAGFVRERQTLWLAEGLFFYLTEATIVALLRRAAELCAPGSLFMADAIGEAGLRGKAMEAHREHCIRNNLPLPFGTDDPVTLLAAGGWHAERVVAAGGPDANFGRLPPVPAGVRPGLPHLIQARYAAS